ncbi:4-hydroxythreonine-4-phosphate dehydrogenase PdxA [Rivibacter subsaxonicus]|uniref:4-hydroxythreonine-4-phosphate dehydrogenase n=1 Tax=Rivibacter subsaxonicus TaxID=457575 RepID=A0A4Q7VGN4_9BURK|nr:4-hydroxythreonine-4-phosphate dehydrogenase PdxA [Rivibacter subsaxonicus]RZT95167.1 4-hydroxythreonine-4-phosphate dehydrogenase [Rivibacter subsaxonicus]
MLQPLALSMGDPLGIGPEILACAFARNALPGGYVVGDLEVMRRAARCVAPHEGGVELPVALIESPADALAVPPRCVPVWQPPGLPPGLAQLPLGRIEAAAGAAAAACIRSALAQVVSGAAAALVTAPIHKEALAAAGEPYPGHTELLQAECGGAPVRMMLANDELRVVLVSIHVSLRDAIAAVTQPAVLQTIRIADAALRRAGIEAPRIAVAGLNPHAGEGGLFGSEEREQIAPAVAAARAAGIDASGPHAPDTVFMHARTGAFDAVVAMYHDQGLIPVKYLGLEQGVNVTLGLPVVRTSPDHGTAFDIAGRGTADPASLIAAARMARRLADAA